MDYAKRAAEINDFIKESRHYIHRHAELSLKEIETTEYIVGQLEKMGIPVKTFDDYTGCIAVIDGGKKGKNVLLRADIDALPIQEESGVEFQSLNDGVMHACGHDAHASMLLGAARLLNETRENLCGSVKLLFQAAEEIFTGSTYYIKNGYLDDVDIAMGMHVWPSVPSGKIAVKDGPLMASCDNFRIIIHGFSSHGSAPHMGKDAVVAASAVILAVQTLVSRINDPLEPLVVSIGKIRAGAQFNVITDKAVMEGTVRTHSRHARAMVEKELGNIVEKTAEAMGCSAEIEYNYLESEVSNDNICLNDMVRHAAIKLYGDDILVSVPPASGSEDFCHIMDKVPSSVFVLLGCCDEASGSVYTVHNGKFKINEDILKIGASLYAQFAADCLNKKEGREIK